MKVQCKTCLDVIESKHRHDLVFCKCGTIYVDGGKDYQRVGFPNGNSTDWIEFDESKFKQPESARVLYKHFKGNLYEVICEAKHTETGEVFVIYKRADGTPGIWARPYDEFHGYHETGVKRFEKV